MTKRFARYIRLIMGLLFSLNAFFAHAMITDEDDFDDLTLIEAASSGQVEDCKTLIEGFGANIDQEDEDGQNALHHAVKNAHLDVCVYLLSQNIDFQKRDNKHMKPIDYAYVQGEMDIVKVILNRSTYRCIKKRFEEIDVSKENGGEVEAAVNSTLQQVSSIMNGFDTSEEDEQFDLAMHRSLKQMNKMVNKMRGFGIMNSKESKLCRSLLNSACSLIDDGKEDLKHSEPKPNTNRYSK